MITCRPSDRRATIKTGLGNGTHGEGAVQGSVAAGAFMALAFAALLVAYLVSWRRGPTPSRLLNALGESRHCVLFGVDIASFTERARDDEMQLYVRSALYRLLSDAFDSSDVPWKICRHEDRGDSVLVVIPAQVPTAAVVNPLIDRLRIGLRKHNKRHSEAAQIQLRVAVHIGEVHRDEHGIAGTAFNHLCRMLDAPVLKRALANARTELALIVSDYFYDSVARHGTGLIDETSFQSVMVEVKETRAPAWMYLPPRNALPPEPLQQRRTDDGSTPSGQEIADHKEAISEE
jgi:class 3 adenylate cyclase